MNKHVIIVDADYIDRVAFNLIVNFERMLERQIPQADLARWVECIALDCGVRESEEQQETTVVLIYEKEVERLRYFTPADYEKELNGKAFRSGLGEFVIHAVPVETITNKTSMLLDTIDLIVEQKEVKRIMVIPNAEEGGVYDQIRHHLKSVNDDKHITLFAMQPMPGGNFRQEILGYSLMQSLGIRGEEI